MYSSFLPVIDDERMKTAYLRGLWFVNHVCRPTQGHRPAGFLYRSFPKSYDLRVDKKTLLRSSNKKQQPKQTGNKNQAKRAMPARPAGFLYRSFPKSYDLRVDKKHFYVLRTKNNNQGKQEIKIKQSGRCPLDLRVDKKHFYVLRTKSNNQSRQEIKIKQSRRCPIWE